jgi:hypothetical protein
MKTCHPNIKNMLINKYPYGETSLQYLNRLNVLLDFIIRTGQPLSLVDNKYFIKLLAVFDDKFKQPHRQYVSKTLIVEKNNKFCESA